MSGHVCLVGKSVSDDWDVIRRLKSDYVVTLIKSFDVNRLAEDSVVDSASLIVLDCTGCEKRMPKIIKFIQSMRESHPLLILVAVNGGLDDRLVAQAFSAGIRDYFRTPYNSKLLVERIASLCRRGGGRIAPGTPPGLPGAGRGPAAN